MICGLFATDFAYTLDFLARSACVEWLESRLPEGADWEFRLLAAGVYALCFALAGRWVASRIVLGAPPKRSMLFAIFGASQVAACTLGMLTMGRAWVAMLVVGTALTAATAPITLLLAHNASWAWRARAGTLLHQSYRRARWIDVATGVTVLLATYANPMFGTGHGAPDGRAGVALLFVLIAGLTAGIVGIYSMLALTRVASLRRRFVRAASAPVHSEGDAPVFDLGIGDERACELTRAASAYRHRDRVEAVCVGDIRRAWRVVGMSLGRSIGVVVAGAFITLAEMRFEALFFGVCV